jgi:hypothetical protein
VYLCIILLAIGTDACMPYVWNIIENWKTVTATACNPDEHFWLYKLIGRKTLTRTTIMTDHQIQVAKINMITSYLGHRLSLPDSDRKINMTRTTIMTESCNTQLDSQQQHVC